MATDIVKVRLSRREVDYLSRADFLNAHQAEEVRKQGSIYRNGAALILSRDLAEEFRETLTEQLAKVGFDQNYEATPEGRLLEELIDRFFLE